jgi:hypothetical protein
MLLAQLALFPVAVAAACWAGHRAARRGGGPLAAAIAGPFVAILLVLVGHRCARAAFIPPFSWAVDADVAPLLMTPAIALLFAALALRLPAPRRPAVWVIMGVMLLLYGLLPAALPLLVRPALGATRTHLDPQGVCRQSLPYSCGPAAAVSCLARLGVTAQEGQIGIAARTAPLVGTRGRLLAQAVRTRHPEVACRHRFVERLDDLSLPAAVEVTTPWLTGHFVAVLAIGPAHVEIADPLNGYAKVPRDRFARSWTGSAVEFARRPEDGTP